MEFPEIINFRISSKCNNNCKFCYFNSKENLKELNFDELKKLFNLFYKKGVKAIVLCGGEPMLRNDFEKIVKELKKYNFKIFLDTNGDFFFKYSDTILKNIDIIGLPIDFYHKSYRNSDNFCNVIKVLDFLKEKPAKPLIRIGTVVTKENIGELKKIGDLIKNYPINMWKIYEFISVNDTNSIKNQSSLKLPLKTFEKVTRRLKSEFSSYFKVMISKREDRANAYFLINPDCSVFLPVDNLIQCKDVVIGNVFDKDIYKKWKKFVKMENYIKNSVETFNYRFENADNEEIKSE